ncbi:ankyrin repeat domain-containing protein [Leptospira interrogans]|uniref:Ankyrin repeat protein n=1 Tax=Leptospira interrogans str. UI 12621 TaxID=1049937 RepID=A0A0F6H5E7_LEPIR|nr:ankyrin repeat domain-containing protein [Leptospira interrogans]EKO23440.1 ankyrin repeat protein [Leptospira interrogans str. UI 12621]ULG81630.1 ankyrin repeat domain-containing protein [Leptospira interrogans]ULG92072.1 ankyrin repeat domain-containing protein [Leptospira interrogans]UML69251.1 ankyrin repeat domain-containing protein [Leptospira interrogans]UML72578.1 ankyrin repeat domain-containing protein [Leptospira interrogans]
MQNGFNPNLNFYHGITSLSVAVKYHRLEIVQVLIEYRADPDLADRITGFYIRKQFLFRYDVRFNSKWSGP